MVYEFKRFLGIEIIIIAKWQLTRYDGGIGARVGIFRDFRD